MNILAFFILYQNGIHKNLLSTHQIKKKTYNHCIIIGKGLMVLQTLLIFKGQNKVNLRLQNLLNKICHLSVCTFAFFTKTAGPTTTFGTQTKSNSEIVLRVISSINVNFKGPGDP